MKYDLACNFDIELLNAVIHRDSKRQVKSMFGKLKFDAIGGGRSCVLLPDISATQLAEYVDKCRAAGIAFNYLLNPMCLGSVEFDPGEHARMLVLIDQLYEVGIRDFTVNSSFLLQLMKKRYADVKITIGLYAYITTLQQVQYWMTLGADELTLDHGCNRNFGLLRSALRLCKGSGVGLRLIANNLCLHDCPFKSSHGCSTSHSSRTMTAMPPFDYHMLVCARQKARDVGCIISSGFIRPEDVKFYRQLAEEVGNDNFSLKLVERTRSSAFLMSVVEAYLSERYDGNLLEIMNWMRKKHMSVVPGPKAGMPAGGAPSHLSGPPQSHSGGPPQAGALSQFDMEAVRLYGKVIDFPEIYVENRKLDGFIDHFVHHYNCDRVVCKAAHGAGAPAVPACSYCSDWASKAVSRDEDAVQQWIADATTVLSSLDESTIFRQSSAEGKRSQAPSPSLGKLDSPLPGA